MKQVIIPVLMALMTVFSAKGQNCCEKKPQKRVVQMGTVYTLEERVSVTEKGLYHVGKVVDRHDVEIKSLQRDVDNLKSRPQQQTQSQTTNVYYVVVSEGDDIEYQPPQQQDRRVRVGLPAPNYDYNGQYYVTDGYNNRAYWDNQEAYWYTSSFNINPFSYNDCYMSNGSNRWNYNNNNRSWDNCGNNGSNYRSPTYRSPNSYSPNSYSPNSYSSGSHQVYNHGPRPPSFTYGGNPSGGNPNGGPRYNGNPGGGNPNGGHSGGGPRGGNGGGGQRGGGGNGGHSGGGHR